MNQATPLEGPEKLWNRSYILVLAVSTLSQFSFYMIATIMSKYLVSLGASITFAGFVVCLFSITSVVRPPFSGLIADNLNNIWLLFISNIIMSIGLFGFSFSSGSMPLMIMFRVLNGVGMAVCGTVQVALIIHFIPRNRTGEGIGYLGVSQLISSACAPAFGLAVAERFGMASTFAAAAILPLLACGMLLFLLKLHVEPAKKASKHISFSDIIDLRAMPFTLPYSTFSFVNGVINGYLVMFADLNSIGNVSIYFTLYAIAVFAVRPFSGKLMDRKGLKYTVFPGMIICALSLFLLGWTTSLWMVLATGLLRALGQGSAQPSLQAGCLNHVGRERSGVATSTYYLGGDIGQGIGPMVGGFILANIAGVAGYQFLFCSCGILMLIAMGYFFVVSKKENIS